MRQMLLKNTTTILLQNALAFLLQIATVLLQNVTLIIKFDDFITKCDSYCKMRRLLKNASVHIPLTKLGLLGISYSILFKHSYKYFSKKKCFYTVKQFFSLQYVKRAYC